MATAKVKNIPDANPLKPPPYEAADLYAFQALEKGIATEGQQKRVLDYIIHNMCQTYDLEYRATERDSCLASGKRLVGLFIVKMLKINPAIFNTPTKPTERTKP